MDTWTQMAFAMTGGAPSDPALEGFFDLGQLVIPTGQTIAQYQLSVEALDPNWSLGVEPYAPTQVAPSGHSLRL